MKANELSHFARARARKNWRKALIKLRAARYFAHVHLERVGTADRLSHIFYVTGKDTLGVDLHKQGIRYGLSDRFINGVSIVSMPEIHVDLEHDEQEMNRYAVIEKFFKYVERGTAVDVDNI